MRIGHLSKCKQGRDLWSTNKGNFHELEQVFLRLTRVGAADYCRIQQARICQQALLMSLKCVPTSPDVSFQPLIYDLTSNFSYNGLMDGMVEPAGLGRVVRAQKTPVGQQSD